MGGETFGEFLAVMIDPHPILALWAIMSMMVARYEAVVLLSSRPPWRLLCTTTTFFFVRAGLTSFERNKKNKTWQGKNGTRLIRMKEEWIKEFYMTTPIMHLFF